MYLQSTRTHALQILVFITLLGITLLRILFSSFNLVIGKNVDKSLDQYLFTFMSTRKNNRFLIDPIGCLHFLYTSYYFLLLLLNNKHSTSLHVSVHLIRWLDISQHCYKLLYTAIHCYTLLYTAIHCYTLLYTAIHCYTLLYIVIHCYTLLYTAIHCYKLIYTVMHHTFRNTLSMFTLVDR